MAVVRVGDWESHTRGIGSRLLQKMGYKIVRALPCLCVCRCLSESLCVSVCVFVCVCVCACVCMYACVCVTAGNCVSVCEPAGRGVGPQRRRHH